MRAKQVKMGERLIIEKNVYIDILWPNKNQFLENPLNNNSIVCKLNYYNFSMLFTGDIEEVAEKRIINEVNNELLEADVLKVAHHGSKTSSIEKFINLVNPKIALIGVGENNKFGHPNEDVIKRLKNCGIRVYRTDKMGEINIIIDSDGCIKITTLVNNNTEGL